MKLTCSFSNYGTRNAYETHTHVKSAIFFLEFRQFDESWVSGKIKVGENENYRNLSKLRPDLSSLLGFLLPILPGSSRYQVMLKDQVPSYKALDETSLVFYFGEFLNDSVVTKCYFRYFFPNVYLLVPRPGVH